MAVSWTFVSMSHLPSIYSGLLTGPEKQMVIEVLAQQHVRRIMRGRDNDLEITPPPDAR